MVRSALPLGSSKNGPLELCSLATGGTQEWSIIHRALRDAARILRKQEPLAGGAATEARQCEGDRDSREARGPGYQSAEFG